MIPDYADALTAYRCWNAYPNGLLVGQNVAEPWPPYEPFRARCSAVSGEGWHAHVVKGDWRPAPVFGCDCGIHALKSADDSEQRIVEEGQGFFVHFDLNRAPGRVWGAVKLWGRVVEHETGYRAEYAYPAALFCEDKTLAPRIARLYGVACAVKVLPRPTPPRIDDLYTSQQVYYLQPSAYSFWRNQSAAPPPQPVQQPGLIVVPTLGRGALATIGGLGASRYQQQQAAKQANDWRYATDWRDVMKKAFHVRAHDAADTETS